MGKIEIGKISAAFGIKGELKLLHYSGEHERIENLEELFLVINEKETIYPISSIRISSKGPIIKLVGVDDRNAAELLVNAQVFVDEDSLAPLDDDSYYINDIIGLKVVSREGNTIGEVSDFIDNPANPVIQIEATDGENDFLLPFVDNFVIDIDLEKREMKIVIPDNLRTIGKKSGN